MKKLMVALTAVALGACAWAEEAATPTLTGKVEFKDATAGQWTPETGWFYTGEANTLNIVGKEGARTLKIETGTAALTRNVWSDGNAGAIDDGIYIDTTIDFLGQQLDEVPVATNDEKLAIFVLDTTEITGAPAGTNVYVMAGYGPSGKALYRIANFDENFVNTTHRVVVKSYADVIDGDTTRTGFLVYIQDGAEVTFNPCTVGAVYAFNTNGDVVWENVMTTGDYLGLTDAFKTTAAVGKWTTISEPKLFISMPTKTQLSQGKLQAVDFVGNAQIASIEVTETNPGFPADLYTMTLNATGVTVEMVSEGFTLADGAITATTLGGTVVVSVKPTTEGWKITADGATENSKGNYEFAFVNGGSVSFTASAVAAYVGETPYTSIADAVAEVKDSTAACTLKLGLATTWPTGITLNGTDVTLDLAGQTLTIAGEGNALANEGVLTIIDSGTGGKVVGPVENYGTLNVQAGIYEGEVFNDVAGTVSITGGSFAKATNGQEAFALATSVAAGLEVVAEGNYWKVQTKAAAQVSLTIVNETGATISGVVAGMVAEGSNITFTVVAAADYKNVRVTVDGATATVDAGTYSFTVGKSDITITVRATAITYATLTITPADHCTITVKNGEAVVESGAKFDVEDNVSLTVTRTPDPGYELDGCAATETITMSENRTVTAAVKAATPTVAPGGQVTVTAETAEAAAGKVELQATSPDTTVVSDATYTGYFTKQVTANGDGTFTVTAVLKDEIVQAADVTAEVAAELNAVAADKATAATVTKAKPGLYYSVKYTDNVASMATAAEGDRVMAKGASVEVPMPKVVNANAMFYQVQVNVAPKAQ